jgi:hypothetical protein
MLEGVEEGLAIQAAVEDLEGEGEGEGREPPSRSLVALEGSQTSQEVEGGTEPEN